MPAKARCVMTLWGKEGLCWAYSAPKIGVTLYPPRPWPTCEDVLECFLYVGGIQG